MRVLSIALAIFTLVASYSAAEQEKRVSADVEKIVKNTTVRQEYVEVSKESYPGLNIKIASPLESVLSFRPSSYNLPVLPDRLRFLHRQPFDHIDNGKGSPYKSGKVVDVSVPAD